MIINTSRVMEHTGREEGSEGKARKMEESRGKERKKRWEGRGMRA